MANKQVGCQNEFYNNKHLKQMSLKHAYIHVFTWFLSVAQAHKRRGSSPCETLIFKWPGVRRQIKYSHAKCNVTRPQRYVQIVFVQLFHARVCEANTICQKWLLKKTNCWKRGYIWNTWSGLLTRWNPTQINNVCLLWALFHFHLSGYICFSDSFLNQNSSNYS